MDKFATLEPVKLYAPALAAPSSGRFLGRSTAKAPPVQIQHLIGRLPADLHILVLQFLALPDVPAYSRCSRALSEFALDERVWEAKWQSLGVERHRLAGVLDELEAKSKGKGKASAARAHAVPPTMDGDIADDDFGDFASGAGGEGSGKAPQEWDGFTSALQAVSLSSHPSVITGVATSSKPTFRHKFIRVHTLLKPLLPALSAPPHQILATLFPPPAPPLLKQSQTLHLLALYLSPAVRPVRSFETLHASLRAAVDRFQANLLSAFDVADGKHDETGMREAAFASWEVWEGHLSSRAIPVGEWETGKVWGEKREIFYEQGRWRPLDNFTKDGTLAFDAMDSFMTHILDSLRTEGATAVRVFPPESFVVLSFAERLAMEVVGEYITSLLTKAREVSNEIFLQATAATFREAWRVVDALVQLNDEGPSAQAVGGKGEREAFVTTTQAEDVIYRMFEAYMDEYLDEEVESVKHSFDVTNREWERKISAQAKAANPAAPGTARFIGSHNPAALKRSVLASFTDVLMLPVTIVPRTVGAVGVGIGNAAVAGIGMLNPQRWVSQGVGIGVTTPGGGYSRDFEPEMLFEAGADEEDRDGGEVVSMTRSSLSSASRTFLDAPPPTSSAGTSLRSSSPAPSVSSTAAPSHLAPSLSKSGSTHTNGSSTSFDQMELQLSLDIVLELIHASRDALKRVETFAGYPGTYGHRVRETIEEVFILLLQAIGERHINPGFERATEQMRTYKPAEHEETSSVAPLMQFFELVHIGDTMQSMVQVYFDKELAPHIDKTDFLNAVVREKKRFENILDDSVAAGMNAGTEVLMNQVEHIILTQTKAREYYPPEDAPLDLGPTKGCTEAIACLDMHCKLLKGSTSKEVLEVFYQEVGIRLLAILHRHIKRQIISLSGGFQVIADLNTYHAFISSLKVQSIASDFSNLKMLGHVYVVEDAKDLAQIVRDVTRYGGAYRPEDIYEFIQRRADWKKIEKTVDKTMYNLSFKEDCIIC